MEALEIEGKQSAQRAEIIALIRALELMKNKTANICTDSAYAATVVHHSLAEWKQNNYQTAGGQTVKYLDEILRLEAALQLPAEVAVIKCKAHTKAHDLIALWNEAADEAAKAAAGYEKKDGLQMVTCSTQELAGIQVEQWQSEASPEEKSRWVQKGAEKTDGIWHQKGKVALPPKNLKILIQEAHGPAHLGRKEVITRLERYWWHPFLKDICKDELEKCQTCLVFNAKPTVHKELVNRVDEFAFPGQEVVIDFTDMINSCNGYRYLLVIVDRFTGWPEAYPCRAETAASVVKHLVNHYIPTHGFPMVVRSDNGTHFKNEHLQKVELLLGLKHKFGSVYHPQSQGCVERMNRTLKERLAKIMHQTGLNWLQALPMALMATRMSVRTTTGLTPYEQHIGWPYLGPQHRLPAFTMEKAEPAVKGLNHVFSDFARPTTLPTEEQKKEILPPGGQVLLKVLKRKWTEPRWTGPFQVAERTSHALRLKGKGQVWFHISQATPYEGEKEFEGPEAEAGE